MRIVYLSCLLFSVTLQAQQQPLVVVGIDGLSSEAVTKANMPFLREIMRWGMSTLEARAVMPTVSSPNWASILMGAGPEHHGITSNEWQIDKFTIPPTCQGPDGLFPNIFSRWKEVQPNSKLAVFHHWDGFARLTPRSILHRIEHHKTAEATMDAAVAYYRAEQPDLLFIHLDEVDHAGHTHGWNTPKYFEEAARADQLLGRIYQLLDMSKVRIAVVSDHGGKDKKHGGESMDEMRVPFAIAGGSTPRMTIQFSLSVTDYALLMAGFDHPCWRAKYPRQ
jgi:predicted AlkP superfamily pyrophosphatase or phosphodiesterase